jgi:hypothetical protein
MANNLPSQLDSGHFLAKTGFGIGVAIVEAIEIKRSLNFKEDSMLRAAIAFFVLALVAMIFGATGFA